MAVNSKIEWTDATWNPVRGCTKISPGCTHCYAETQHGLPRVRHLQSAPAGLRFLSVEPLLESLGSIGLSGIHWVIVGGESGAGARPVKGEWVREVRGQCQREGVAFFFKQWGGFQKARAGRTLDGRTYDEVPATSLKPVPDSATPAALKERLVSLATPWSSSSLHSR